MRYKSVTKNERGFTSLVVALIFVTVMSLVTVGFAQLARHEQQNALDKQLSNQAYYAAESGINEVRKELPALQAAYDANPSNVDPTKCLGSPYIQNLSSVHNPYAGVIDTSSDVTYTCVLVNLSPDNNPGSGGNTYGALNDIFTTSNLDHLVFTWGSNDVAANNQPRATGGFPPQSQWGNSPPVVQLSITPVDPGGPGAAFDRNSLIQGTFTFYAYPTNGSVKDPITGITPPLGSIAYGADASYPDSSPSNAPIVNAIYDTSYPGDGSQYPYKVTITGLPGTANETWLVHVVWFYDSIKTDIQGFTITGTKPAPLSNSVAQIDVTGKAKNVAKRILEYVPIPQSNSGSQTTQNGLDTLPYFAVDAGATCSRITSWPATPGAPLNSNSDYNAGISPNDCQLSN